mmetsp:Transcript_57444/g.101974  ORF Transcript_57444/g.101974 Transcript_57444/m.101974 type:complete len:234 (-) Transcript_57444:28-729(-)
MASFRLPTLVVLQNRSTLPQHPATVVEERCRGDACQQPSKLWQKAVELASACLESVRLLPQEPNQDCNWHDLCSRISGIVHMPVNSSAGLSAWGKTQEHDRGLSSSYTSNAAAGIRGFRVPSWSKRSSLCQGSRWHRVQFDHTPSKFHLLCRHQNIDHLPSAHAWFSASALPHAEPHNVQRSDRDQQAHHLNQTPPAHQDQCPLDVRRDNWQMCGRVDRTACIDLLHLLQQSH